MHGDYTVWNNRFNMQADSTERKRVVVCVFGNARTFAAIADKQSRFDSLGLAGLRGFELPSISGMNWFTG